MREAAERLGISQSLVYALCNEFVIRHTRHGRPGKRGCIRIEECAIEEYLQKCRAEGQQPSTPLELNHINMS